MKQRPITAYLVVHLDTSVSPPVVTGAGIYSESARSLTGAIGRRVFAFDALQASGEDFVSAKMNVIKDARDWRCYDWALELVERGSR